MLALAGWVLVLGFQVDDKAADEAVDRFRKGMANPNASARASAVLELSRVPHDKTLKNLLPCLTADVKDVRKAAAKGLGAFGDWKKIVTPALTAALGGVNAKEGEVRCEIFGALGRMADPLALSTVHGAFKDDDVRVAKAAIGAAGAMRQKESIDALLDLQKQIQKWLKNKQAGPYRDDKGQQGDERAYTDRLNDVQKTILDAFKKITLERWGSAQEWEIWWNRKKAGYEVPPAPEEKDGK